MTSLTRFQAYSADPKDQSGIVTYTHGNLTVNVPIATFVHAQQLAAFIDAAVADAARRAMPETEPAEARRMVWAWWQHDHPEAKATS